MYWNFDDQIFILNTDWLTLTWDVLKYSDSVDNKEDITD